jgi:hypothetical protein
VGPGRPARHGRGGEITAAKVFIQPGAQLGLQGRRKGEEGAGHGGKLAGAGGWGGILAGS